MKRNREKGTEILQQAMIYYQSLAKFRQERDRNKRYNYGDQWSDIIEVDGRHMTEEQYIKEQGNIPLKNNLIRRLVRNVIGVYNSQTEQPTCIARDQAEKAAGQTMDTLLRYNSQVNRMNTLYMRSMEEFLISGMVVHKKTFGKRGDRCECWTDYVQPNNFFIDTMARDFRGWDCRCVGEIHHVPFTDVCMQFAHDADDYKMLRNEFGAVDDDRLCTITEVWRRENRTFYRCHDKTTGSISEVCSDDINSYKASHPDSNCQWHIDMIWRYYFITPGGLILSSGDTPYAHKGHPYVVRIYPMIDGEIHSFVSDVVDQQRYTNRLITLYDWIMRASAKGVLLVPEDCIPRGCNPTDFADVWSRYNGVIFYKPSAQGNIPKQIASNSTNIGIRELLDIQLRFFEDISGVNNALQGKTNNVAISAELYNQQTQNATTTLLDILDTFNEFVRDGIYIDMKNILQYYSMEKVKKIAGADASIEALQDVEFDLAMTPITTSPAYKQSNNNLLLEIWKSGQITLEQMLRAGNFSFADSLLDKA